MPSSVFDTLTSARHSSASSRRCWRRGGGAAKCEGGWCGSPPRSGPDRGDVSPRREGARAYARTTSPHPSGRSPSSVPALAVSSTAHLHTSCREYPSGARSLTARAAPCLTDRDFFASTFESLASSPIDGLQVGEAREHSTGSRSSSTRTAAQGKKPACSAWRGACDGPACMCVRCAVRCVGGATLSPHDLESSPPWMYVTVRCRRVSMPNVLGDCAIIYM